MESIVLKTGHDRCYVLYELASDPEPALASLLNQQNLNSQCASLTMTVAEICTLALHRSHPVSVEVA